MVTEIKLNICILYIMSQFSGEKNTAPRPPGHWQADDTCPSRVGTSKSRTWPTGAE